MTNVKQFLALSVLIIPISLVYAYDGTLTNCNGTELINVHAYQTGEKKTVCYDTDERGEGAFLHDDIWGHVYVIKDGQIQIRIEQSHPDPEHPEVKVITGYEYHIIQLFADTVPEPKKGGGGSTGSYLLASHNVTETKEPRKVMTIKELCEYTKTKIVTHMHGLVTACQTNIHEQIWTGENGRLYQRHVFHDITYNPDIISWTDVTPFKQKECKGMNIRVQERSNCAFKYIIEDSQAKAKAKFDADKFKSEPKPFKALDQKIKYADCDGAKVTLKALDCKIHKQMIKEQEKAIKKFNATKLINKNGLGETSK